MMVNKKPKIQNIREDIEYTEKILEVTINERDRYILHRLISEQKEFLSKLESSKADFKIWFSCLVFSRKNRYVSA